jgi:hypothetical protein
MLGGCDATGARVATLDQARLYSVDTLPGILPRSRLRTSADDGSGPAEGARPLPATSDMESTHLVYRRGWRQRREANSAPSTLLSGLMTCAKDLSSS